MATNFILLVSVSALQFCGFVSAAQLRLLRCSEYGLEDKMADIARKLGYDASITPSDDCNFLTTLRYKRSFEVVINFGVTIPEDYDFGYGGDMITDYYGTINKTLTSCIVNENQTDAYGRLCIDPGFNAHTKIFMGSIEEHYPLFNIFDTITNNLMEDRTSYDKYTTKEIVFCSGDQRYCPVNETEGFLFPCKRCDKIFECSDNTVAIVAPSPKRLTTCDENIPVIFYDTIYVEPDNLKTIYEEEYISDFTTSTTMIHWNEIASSLRGYLHKYKWPRIAIVSDDSLLSYHMTNDQVNYFEDTGTVFTVIRDCTDGRAFKEALKFLNKYEIQVIIVNVVKENLNKFIEGANAADIVDANIIWVFPGHRPTNNIKDFKFKLFVHFTCDSNQVVRYVVKKYHETLGVEKQFKRLINDQRSWNKICDVTAVSIPSRLHLMGLPNCAMVTSNYFYYCADWYVLYLILAIIVFLLLVFCVLLFFNQIQMNTLAYKPLHEPPSLWRQMLRREKRPQPQRFPMRRRY